MRNYFSKEMPERVENRGSKRVLNYNIRKATDEEIRNEWLMSGVVGESEPTQDFKDSHKWVYNQVSVPMGKWRYDMVVDAIVRDKYRSDEMEAMTNNMAAINAVFMQTLVSDGIIAATKYLKDSIDDVNTQNFKAMQEWRAMAKREAKEVFG